MRVANSSTGTAAVASSAALPDSDEEDEDPHKDTDNDHKKASVMSKRELKSKQRGERMEELLLQSREAAEASEGDSSSAEDIQAIGMITKANVSYDSL